MRRSISARAESTARAGPASTDSDMHAPAAERRWRVHRVIRQQGSRRAWRWHALLRGLLERVRELDQARLAARHAREAHAVRLWLGIESSRERRGRGVRIR